VLSVKNIEAYYGRIRALRGISLEVEQGEIVTLIGANGAGKSSTLRCISGSLRARTGEIVYKGKATHRMNAEKVIALGLAHVPEGRKIFPRMTVEENLDIGAYLVVDKKLIAGRKEKCFELFPILAKRRAQKGGTLSGGEQQMLAIARALMQDPDILLLDEPSMGLAPLLVDQIFETIVELNKRGKTILLVEQNARKALQIAHRGYVLQTGAISLSGAAADLAKDPAVQVAYLGGAKRVS
jgi:branched-chain amino acid transport system ATP-binding protein